LQITGIVRQQSLKVDYNNREIEKKKLEKEIIELEGMHTHI